MSTAHVPRARRTPACDDIARAEQVDAADGWPDRLRRFLLTKAVAASACAKHALLAMAAAALDTGISSLQRLRTLAGGAQDADEGRDDERRRPGKRAPRERRDAEPEAPRPVARKPRRLRSLLVHLCVMLAGGMAGMALAYDLLAQLLDRQSASISRQEIKLSKYVKLVAEFEKKLDLGQAQRIEAETRLAAAVAENEKKLIEQQAKRTAAEKQLATVLAEHANNVPRQEIGSGDGRSAASNGQLSSARSGNCTLGGSNIRSALIGCVDELNRR